VTYKYYVIADQDTVLAFGLVGVPGVVVNDAPQALQALRAVRGGTAGIVILTQEVGAMVQEEVDAIRFGETVPMVVEIPGRGGPLAGRRSLSDVIRGAVGIRV
jgi:V/A-type H+-transporting ATPase subunit F